MIGYTKEGCILQALSLYFCILYQTICKFHLGLSLNSAKIYGAKIYPTLRTAPASRPQPSLSSLLSTRFRRRKSTHDPHHRGRH